MWFIFLQPHKGKAWVSHNSPGNKDRYVMEELVTRVKENLRPYRIELKFVEFDT